MKNKREFNYKNQVNNTGEFSPHITDKKLVKQLDAYCLITNTNKTKYVVEATKEKLKFDLDNLQLILNGEDK